jgi:hypothetical protein
MGGVSEQQPGTPGTRPEEPAATPAPARPGRPPRTTNGLIGAMIITLLAIGAFVALRAVTRTDLEVEPEAVDYRSAAAAAHDAGRPVVYPERLPRGWIATSVDYVPGDRPAWGVGMLTEGGDFVGVRQEDAPLDDLLATYVDEQAEEGDRIDVTGSVAPRWQEFADRGGDHAYAAELGEDEVLVYGSAPTADLRRVLELLTDQEPQGDNP